MSDHKFAAEDACHTVPNFLSLAGAGTNADRRVHVGGKVLALQSRGIDPRVETTRGPGILDRVGRDGICYVWFGRLAPGLYWSIARQQANEEQARRYHEALDRGERPPKPVEQECRVAEADAELVDDGMSGPCAKCKRLAPAHPVHEQRYPAPDLDCEEFEPIPRYTRKGSQDGEHVIYVKPTGSRIVEEMHVDDITCVTEDEHARAMEQFETLEAMRIAASPKRRRQVR